MLSTIANHGAAEPFLRSVVPSEGKICIVGIRNKTGATGEVRHYFWSSHQDAVVCATRLAQDGFNAYFACATFKSDKRKSENAHSLSSFFLDLDCGGDKPYADQVMAAKALKMFCRGTRLPQPTIVNSGRGLHIYWMLDSPIPVSDWKPVAEALKLLCMRLELSADHTVTADAARILRVPGTTNLKDPSNPLPVKVLTQPTPIAFSVFRGLVTGAEALTNLAQRPEWLKKITGSANVKLLSPEAELPETFTPAAKQYLKASAPKIARHCNQIGIALRTHGSRRSEPLWHADLGVLKHTVEGAKACHDASRGHAGYDFNQCQKKIDSWNVPPTTCAHYNSINPDDCEGCVQLGTIHSPIQLGYAKTTTGTHFALDDGRFTFDSTPPGPRQYFAGDFRLPGKLSISGGLGGVSKTTFEIQLACHIATGKPFGTIAVEEGASLLFLGEENDEERMRRFGAACVGFTAEEKRLVKERVRAFPAAGVDLRITKFAGGNSEETGLHKEIIRLAAEHVDGCGVPVRMIVIDHARLALGGDPNSAEHVTQLTRLLTNVAITAQAAVVLLAHSPKSAMNAEEASQKDIAGSSAFVDNGRSATLLLKMTSDEEKRFGIPDRNNYVRLYVVKNNDGPTGGEYWFRRVPVPSYGAAVLEPVDLLPTVKMKGTGKGVAQRIVDLIRQNPGMLSRTSVRNRYSGKGRQLQASEKEVEQALNTLLGDGRVIARAPTPEERKAHSLSSNIKQVLAIPGDPSGGQSAAQRVQGNMI